jgi:hypothetical protein
MSRDIKKLEMRVRTGSSQVRQTGRWQSMASAVETTTRSKEPPAQSLSYTEVP